MRYFSILMFLVALSVFATPAEAHIFGHHGRIVYVNGVPHVVYGHHGRFVETFPFFYNSGVVVRKGDNGSGGGLADKTSKESSAAGSDEEPVKDAKAANDRASDIADLKKRVKALEDRFSSDDAAQQVSSKPTLEDLVTAHELQVEELAGEFSSMILKRDGLLTYNEFLERSAANHAASLAKIQAQKTRLKGFTIPVK